MIETTALPASLACDALEVSKQAFYMWKKRVPHQSDDSLIVEKIKEIAYEFPKYGYRRMTKELFRRSWHVNHKKVLNLMRKNNLLVKRKKFKPITTNSNHGFKVFPNLAKNMIVTKPNQLWVSDITYIYLIYGFVYLAAIIDLFSRKCIGWFLDKHVDTQLTLSALDMAISSRKHLGFSELIHHSDRGVQYAADAYVQKLNQFNIQISMSGKGNAYDNAFAESFFKTLKVEEVYIKEYKNFEDAYNNIKHFIGLVYNEKRLHSGVGYLPPVEFEQEFLNRQSP
jgi:transposase InsO family protein